LHHFPESDNFFIETLTINRETISLLIHPLYYIRSKMCALLPWAQHSCYHFFAHDQFN
jgi:hypothetical protein